MDLIIAAFNERYFTGWDATLDEPRVKLVNILKHTMSDPAFRAKVVNNDDVQNCRIASEALFVKAMRRERRREIELYKKYASDDDVIQGVHDPLLRTMGTGISNPILALQD